MIASQWKVDDASTGVLIGKLFEQVIAEEQAGREVDYAKALRGAQKAVKDDPSNKWSDPFYWAPFILIGLN